MNTRYGCTFALLLTININNWWHFIDEFCTDCDKKIGKPFHTYFFSLSRCHNWLISAYLLTESFITLNRKVKIAWMENFHHEIELKMHIKLQIGADAWFGFEMHSVGWKEWRETKNMINEWMNSKINNRNIEHHCRLMT